MIRNKIIIYNITIKVKANSKLHKRYQKRRM
jgi:hypothetical protein